MIIIALLTACSSGTLTIDTGRVLDDVAPRTAADTETPADSEEDTGVVDTGIVEVEPSFLVLNTLEVHTDALAAFADIIGDGEHAYGLLIDGRMINLTTGDSLPTDTGITGNVGSFWLPGGANGFCAHTHQTTFVAEVTELACWDWSGALINQWTPGTAAGYGAAVAHSDDGTQYVLESGSAELGAQVWEGGTLTLGEWSDVGPYGTSMVFFEGRLWIAANHDIIKLSNDGSLIAEVTSTITRSTSELSAPAAQAEAELVIADGTLFFSGWLGGSLRREDDGTWSDISVLPEDQDMSYWPRELRTGEVFLTSTKGAIGALDGSWSGVVPGAETCDGEQALRTWPVDPATGEFLWACRGTTTWGRAQLMEEAL